MEIKQKPRPSEFPALSPRAARQAGPTKSTGRAAGILVGSLRENLVPPPTPRLRDVVDLRESMENRVVRRRQFSMFASLKKIQGERQ